MRFNSAILATLVVASMGVQALLPPEEPTRPGYASSALSITDTATYKPSEPSKPPPTDTPKPPPTDTYKPHPTNTPKPPLTNKPKPPPTDTYKPHPTDTYKPPPPDTHKPGSTSTYQPEHPKPSDTPQEPDYEAVCKQFAFFHNWDLDCGDLPSGRTEGKYIYECAEDCLENQDCDATVSFEGYCYPKTLDDFQPSKLVKKEGRDMAILGSCEDLQKEYEKTKCYPDGFLDCCYDKHICTEDTKTW